MKQQDKNTRKKVKKSIRSQIIATGLCPLIAMSTAVSILSLGGYDQMLIADIIAAILLIGTLQLLYVAHNIVKPIRKAEECMRQLAEGNLDIVFDKSMEEREDEIGSMSEALTVLRDKLRNSIHD